jgi:hypothetical protein
MGCVLDPYPIDECQRFVPLGAADAETSGCRSVTGDTWKAVQRSVDVAVATGGFRVTGWVR